ncbi:MAG: ABC transporter permease [Dysgonamonadaceae bacterium]|jgi:ABC-2 type transport system permease protein|nr:ABC transporter permease [Dysgonamonadaceae bacterium]
MALSSKIGIVIQREYLTRVKKKSFIFMTVLMPLLFVGLSLTTFFLAAINEGKAKVIVVVDETGEYFPVLKSTDQYQFIESKTGFRDFRKNSDESVYATLVISGDLLTNPDAITLYSAKPVVSSAEEAITSELNNYLSDKKLESYNIPNLKQIIEDSKIRLNLKSVRWDVETGSETQTSSTMVSAIGIVFAFLIYMFIMMYGGMVMQGVMEEKNNRIVEVIVSSVKSFDLLMGKLIGIGLVGLTQFGIWFFLLLGVQAGAFVFLGNSEVFQTLNASLGSINIVELAFYFILFFIGGYLIYSSLFAAIGAIINSPEDAQQYMTPITILILFAFYTGFYSAQNPDGPLAFWTSLFPFTSPIVMMVRIPYGVHWWELSLSIILLFGSVFFVIKIVAKIYRVGILMYGKKPTYKELTKWLKY